EPGDVLLLQGPLGAGKTSMTKGIARGAGSADLVNSPTFVLINEYKGRLKLYHADLYRLEEAEEIAVLDLSDHTADGVLIAEWPERGQGLLPEAHVLVQIETDGETQRRITLSAKPGRPQRLLAALSTSVPAASGVHD